MSFDGRNGSHGCLKKKMNMWCRERKGGEIEWMGKLGIGRFRERRVTCMMEYGFTGLMRKW